MTKKVKVFTVTETPIQNFEDVLDKLGGFGRFQFMVLALMLFMEIPSAFLTMIPVFIGTLPKTWTCNGVDTPPSTICTCNGTLDSFEAGTSIVSEWGLVCDQVWVSDFITMVQMVGMFLSTFFFGTLSDWYGRRYTFAAGILLQALGQCISAVAPNPYVYAFARLVAGAGVSGSLSISAIYSIEFMTSAHRPLGGVGPWGDGVMLLAGLAYLIKPWRALIWYSMIPYLMILVMIPLVPESPRWLLRQQRVSETHKVVSYMAKVNGKPAISLEILKMIAAKEVPVDNGEGVKRFSYLEFFRDKSLRKCTICFMLIFFCWSLTTFGVGYNIKNMPGNIYMNVVYYGLSDALGYPAPIIIKNKIGRQKSVVLFLSMAAIPLVTIAIVDVVSGINNYPNLLLALLFFGKFGMGGARSSARCFMAESFPTAVRSMGSSLCGIAVAIGAIISPQLAFLGTFYPSIPYFAFAVLSLCAAGVSFLLAETKGKVMSDEVKPRRTSIIDIITRRLSSAK